MHRTSAPAILAAAAAALLTLSAGQAAAAAGPGLTTAGQAGQAAPGGPHLSPDSLPLTFQPNEGQASPSVRYLGQTQGVTALFTAAGVTLDLARATAHHGTGRGAQMGAQVTLMFLHANPHPRITGGGRQPGTVNYFIGGNRAAWHADIPTYARVIYHNLWPGVTAGFTARGGTLKYWFTLAPHASASEIQLAYTGARGITVGKSGSLLIDAAGTRLGDHAPVSTQTVTGHRSPVASAYRLAGGTRFGFTLGHRAPGAVVTIDPGLDYGTYLGGSVADSAFSIGTDKAGDVYVFGQTASPDFPITPGAYQTKLSAKIGGTFFVTKLNPTGTRLVYSTFVGGTRAQGLASGVVDSSGDAYVTGESLSTDFPTTPGAYRRSPDVSPHQSVVFKLNPTGSKLMYSTYLAPDLIGGAGNDIALAGDGSVIVIGGTDSDYAPTTPGAFERNYPGGLAAGYVARVNPAGTRLVYATYLGSELTNQQALVGPNTGNQGCGPAAVAAGAQGAAYITGQCDAGFPTTPGAYRTTALPAGAGLLVKLDPSGHKLDYATYWGHAVTQYPTGTTPVIYQAPGGTGVTVDSKGDAYISGGAWSGSIPVTPGAYQSHCTPNAPSANDAHPPCAALAEFSPDGKTLLYSSYFGGNQGDGAFAEADDITVDSSGRMYIVGLTSPGMVPITPNAYQPSPGNFALPFYLAVLGKNGLDYSTYYGGTASVCIGPFCGLARGTINIAPETSPGAVYLGGTSEINMPVSQGAFQQTYPGGLNAAWIGKLSLPSLPPGG